MAAATSKPSRWHAPWSAFICLLFLYATVHEVERLRRWERAEVLDRDIGGYYNYLPAAFIHHDLLDLHHVADLNARVPGPTEPYEDRFGIHHVPGTGHDLIKYPYGTALFEAPLFLLAHVFCHLPGVAYAPDGFSPPYQLAVAVSAALSAVLGLLVLRRLLLRHVTDEATAIALTTIGFGTNLFFYSTVEAGMGHTYLFFLFALVTERTDQWHRTPKSGIAAVIGLAIGLTLVTRPVDGLVALVPLLWNMFDPGERQRKWALLREHRVHVAIALGCALLPVVPQSIYWRAATGHWIFFSYVGEGFDLRTPHVIDGLFSYRKGWLVYSPLVALGFIGSALMLFRRGERGYALTVLAYFIPAIWLIFSWHDWAYGGSFGCRPLIPVLALLALPIATLCARLLARPRAVGLALIVVVMAGVHLNLFQQDQYRQTIIHWNGMTKERYWAVFGVDRWDHLEPFDP